jgi:regulator of replication initiation timing
MNEQERSEIESVRKEIHEIIGDDVILHVRLSNVTSRLWRLSHKREKIHNPKIQATDSREELFDKVQEQNHVCVGKPPF